MATLSILHILILNCQGISGNEILIKGVNYFLLKNYPDGCSSSLFLF